MLYLEISRCILNHYAMNLFKHLLSIIIPIVFSLLATSCMEEEKTVTLGGSVVDKKISMTTYNCIQSKVEVYLVSYDAVEGELLAKALNAKGKEIGRSKQMLNLGKDDAKLITFTFDASVSLDEVSRFILDFRKK
jgi:hypothetical protein